MKVHRILAGAAGLFALTVSAPALATCADLARTALSDGRVVSAEVVPAGTFQQPGAMAAPGVAPADYGALPAFCRVRLHLTPSADSDINSEVWLPLDDWNGKYVGIGNGIWAGTISYAQMAEPLARGYAAASTDTGHTGNGLTATWAVGHPERLVDFGHRAVHVTTVAAKALVRAMYGRGPDLSLWNSCSTGGRQGLMAAHRYPEDFDAISAMAPANPMTDLMVQSMWAGWQPQRYAVQLTPQVLGMVHGAAVAQCDALDGVTDGLVSRPLACTFDPVQLQCRPGQGEGCLSPGQVGAMQSLYRGTRAADGEQLLPGWPVGSEMQMALLVMGQEPFPVATSYFRDLVFGDQPGWDWRTFDYRSGLAASGAYGAAILDVPSDGLAAFFARGGKLLLSHGWADGLIPATNTLAFHHDLFNALPPAQRDGQLRLFMAPGMDHCAGGEGPSSFDTLGTIDAWAHTGVAPARIVATRPTAAPSMPGQPPAPPRAAMTRPLCPWPLVEIYNGTGDASDAASFTCAAPPT
ncbi:tannase/feruloyl esterase family alpha/beta hydrolase [Erythrobacter arachoides]|uniref:Tannase/feruloyl esterase family alpha/beta hydrolase n=1 Tax=Aurantiacibacter arachoides TaxID=1850444 RepID=A0A845A9B8_9SPHN|nr:tannase/feruloyl esterase family alpha/beta hydrolase [Aurantiacibacter arachoides]MXO94169.1 tannase/feruloyl esterase family alpha/beta hydrolase [Aurantiacibacter arachoides]GGD65538.1 putative esterase [Aurantiacibacter arachoides]